MALNSMLACIAMTTVLSTGCDVNAEMTTVRSQFDRTFQVTGPVTLTITNGSGDVSVTPGTDGTVRVVGRIRAHESPMARLSASERANRLAAAPPLVQDGSAIRVGEITDKALQNNLSIDYEITVPAATRVISKSGSGDQTIGAIAGPVEIATGSGDLNVGPVQGSVTISTGSGDINVLGARGAVTMNSGSGDLHASNVEGRVIVKTASGDIHVDGVASNDWTVGAASGDIDVRLPADARFTLAASTNSGGVEVIHRLDPGADQGRRHVAGTANGGGARVTLSTASGSIRVD